jgi:hypothetical protein
VLRLSEYFRTRAVDPPLLFARGAVLVFSSQAGYIAALVIITLMERWLRLHSPALAPDHGSGRIAWFALMFLLTGAVVVVQLLSIRLLAFAVRPWTSHSFPALACIFFALVGLVVLTMIFYLLIAAARAPVLH